VTKARIFVSIASYRDPECQHTVRDLYAKAAHPENISVGICWQFDALEDEDCFVVYPPFPEQVRINSYDARESKGGCWARADALSLLKDEDYVLQIDAHMRFAPGWDDKLLAALAQCPGKAALTALLPGYAPPDRLEDMQGNIRIICAQAMGKAGEAQPLHLGSRKALAASFMQPFLSAFYVANFMFAPARLVRDVPYDPHIYFRGQELTYSARLWTHGWDLYQPCEVLAYHYWASKSRSFGTSADYKTMNPKAELAYERVWHLLTGSAASPEALNEIECYGMGKERSLTEYWAFADIDLIAGKIGPKAWQGRWP
jgi:glycosyltransferase involved in cell wall biosynthesis